MQVKQSRLANGTKKQTDWNAIEWRKANRTVRNLRHRIFRATQEGNLKKVRSLQKLMLKSYSNRLVSVRRVSADQRWETDPWSGQVGDQNARSPWKDGRCACRLLPLESQTSAKSLHPKSQQQAEAARDTRRDGSLPSGNDQKRS